MQVARITLVTSVDITERDRPSACGMRQNRLVEKLRQRGISQLVNSFELRTLPRPSFVIKQTQEAANFFLAIHVSGH
jgi:hypothetical protein